MIENICILFSSHILSVLYFCLLIHPPNWKQINNTMRENTPHCFHLERPSLKHWLPSIPSLTSRQRRNDLLDRQIQNILNTVLPILVCSGCYNKNTVDQVASLSTSHSFGGWKYAFEMLFRLKKRKRKSCDD